jgi:arginyl-tRNA--protein-N-Asp/Glu arginylyltransferase
MSKTVNTAKPSARSKALEQLETSEELQKDIQKMYSEASKIVAKNESSEKGFLFKRALYSMKKPLEETHDVTSFKRFQVEKFWNDAYTHLEHIKSIK